MTEYLAPLTAFIFVLLLVWVGSNTFLEDDIKTRVARQFDQLVKTDVVIPPECPANGPCPAH